MNHLFPKEILPGSTEMITTLDSINNKYYFKLCVGENLAEVYTKDAPFYIKEVVKKRLLNSSYCYEIQIIVKDLIDGWLKSEK